MGKKSNRRPRPFHTPNEDRHAFIPSVLPDSSLFQGWGPRV